MKIKFLVFIFSLFVFLNFATFSYAEPRDSVDYKETFVRGKVMEVLNQGLKSFNGVSVYSEKLKVNILEGQEKGKIVIIDRSTDPRLSNTKISKGEGVVIDVKPDPKGVTQYVIYEPYRLNSLLIIAAIFLLFVIFIAGRRGIGAVIGLTISVLVISLWIIPQILAGADPLRVCIVGSFVILIITTYIAHGVSLKTTVAILGTAISLVFAAWLSNFLVSILHVFGLGSEDIYNLQIGTPNPINPSGLLLGSILIGTLGALNDITTTQAMTMFTLVKESASRRTEQKMLDLFEKGMIIGKEHIASLINTLVLAYAGSSLAIFIFFELNPAHLPWWVILNNESTIEEIVRSLVGAGSLIFAVPLTTLIATWVALKGKKAISALNQ